MENPTKPFETRVVEVNGNRREITVFAPDIKIPNDSELPQHVSPLDEFVFTSVPNMLYLPS